jgi:transmembrane protein EpsG
MESLFYLLFTVTILALLAESMRTSGVRLKNASGLESALPDAGGGNAFLVIIIAVIMSIFAGLRTEHNDTFLYIFNYINLIPANIYEISKISYSIGDHPVFVILQVIIKHYISRDPQVFLLISAFIVNVLFVYFFYKYSARFSLAVFIYITSGLFVFGMAGMKQVLAMSVGIWAVHYALKNKWLAFLLLLFLASFIHPYVIFYGLTPFLKNKIWTVREFAFILVAIFGAFLFDRFIVVVAEVHSAITEEYGLEDYLGKSGVNFLRVVVYAVTPFLSYIFRKKLRTAENTMLTVCINFSIISFAFMFLALFGNPVVFTRMAIYFDPFTIVALTYILINCISRKQRFTVIALCIASYSFYFYYQFAIAQPFVYKSIIGSFFN